MKEEWRLLRAGVAATVGVRAFVMAASVGSGMLLARLLPLAELGAFYLLAQAGAVCTLLTAGGVGVALQRNLPVQTGRGDWSAARGTLSAAGRLWGVALVVCAGILIPAWGPLAHAVESPPLRPLLPCALLLGLFGGMEEVASVYFRATGRPRLGALLLEGPKQLLFVLGIVALALAGAGDDLAQVAWLRTGAAVLAALAGAGLLLRDLRGRGTSAAGPGAESLQRLVAYTSPVVVHLAAAYLLANADQWFLGLLLGTAQVGVYGVAARLAAMVGLPLAIVNVTLPPLLSSLHQQGRTGELEVLMRRTSTATGIAAVAMLLLFVLGGRLLLRVAYGDAFAGGHVPLAILALGQACNVCSGSPGWLLQMTGHQALLMRITLASLLMNLALNVVGVWLAGAVGAAVATSASMLAQNVAMLAAVRRLVGVRAWTHLDPRRAFSAPGRDHAGA